MTLSDIIALAKQGYKPNDIKELLDIAATSNTPVTAEEPADVPASAEEPAEPEKKEDEPDYKALYEQSQKDLKEAQKANARNPQPEVKTETGIDVLADFARSCM